MGFALRKWKLAQVHYRLKKKAFLRAFSLLRSKMMKNERKKKKQKQKKQKATRLCAFPVRGEDGRRRRSFAFAARRNIYLATAIIPSADQYEEPTGSKFPTLESIDYAQIDGDLGFTGDVQCIQVFTIYSKKNLIQAYTHATNTQQHEK